MVSIFGTRTPLQLTDTSVAVLVVLACSAMGVYGIVLGGYASGSTYPLLGGLRSAAQVISYEVAMGLSIVAVFMTANTMSTSGIVAAQEHGGTGGGWHTLVPGWYGLLLLPSLVIYFVSAVGETNRAPFDLPEAESELVGGFHTEYSSLKFALFFLAEYINMVTVSGLLRDAVPGRLARAVAAVALARRQLRLVAAALVHHQAADHAVRLRVAARHHAAAAVRPVHAPRLEGADPVQPGLDPGACRRPGDAELAPLARPTR